jgi:hypothetical protein
MDVVKIHRSLSLLLLYNNLLFLVDHNKDPSENWGLYYDVPGRILMVLCFAAMAHWPAHWLIGAYKKMPTESGRKLFL